MSAWWRAAWLQRLLAAALGLVFVYASHDKIWTTHAPPAGTAAGIASAGEPVTGPAAFARVVYRYQVVGPDARFPPWVANLVAVALPWVELLVGLLLIAGVWRREAALVAAVLLATFVVAVTAVVLRGIDVQNCGCFNLDGGGRRAGWLLVVGDLALLAVAVFLAWGPPPDRPRS